MCPGFSKLHVFHVVALALGVSVKAEFVTVGIWHLEVGSRVA